MDFNIAGARLKQSFKEGLDISAEFDNDYSNLMAEINDANISDEQMYLHF